MDTWVMSCIRFKLFTIGSSFLPKGRTQQTRIFHAWWWYTFESIDKDWESQGQWWCGRDTWLQCHRWWLLTACLCEIFRPNIFFVTWFYFTILLCCRWRNPNMKVLQTIYLFSLSFSPYSPIKAYLMHLSKDDDFHQQHTIYWNGKSSL